MNHLQNKMRIFSLSSGGIFNFFPVEQKTETKLGTFKQFSEHLHPRQT